jgi:hypothetical protein
MSSGMFVTKPLTSTFMPAGYCLHRHRHRAPVGGWVGDWWVGGLLVGGWVDSKGTVGRVGGWMGDWVGG